MNDTKQTIVDVASGTVTYYGEAKLGNASSSGTWKIKKVVVAGAITTTYYPRGTDGRVSDAPLFVWDDRASLDYSLTHDTTVLASNTSLTGVDISTAINQTPTIATEGVKVTVGNANIGGAVIATTGSFATTITVTGTSSATPGNYSGPITVQDIYGNTKVITISLLVSEPI